MADGPNVSWSHIIQWQKQHTKKNINSTPNVQCFKFTTLW
jgi:hypothetical protein